MTDQQKLSESLAQLSEAIKKAEPLAQLYEALKKIRANQSK